MLCTRTFDFVENSYFHNIQAYLDDFVVITINHQFTNDALLDYCTDLFAKLYFYVCIFAAPRYTN